MNVSKEFEKLYSRLDDLISKAEKGQMSSTDFLSPREQHYALVYLEHSRVSYALWGGYDGAERKRIYVLPEYMEEVDFPKGLHDFGEDADISVLRIKGSGYRVHSHRDFLGSLLGLGIERKVLGDIATDEDGFGAYVFCNSAIVDFLCVECTKIASDKIKCSVEKLPESFKSQKKTVPVSDTVASCRLDCVVGALLSVSRAKASLCVSEGLCEVDFEPEDKCDRIIKAPCLISVRGHGRFEVLSLEDKTKKGRIRLIAERFI